MSLPSLRSFCARFQRASHLLLTAGALLCAGARAEAQVRERPVPFDSAGRVSAITPPMAARLGLAAPVWPVTGDFLDARLYEIGDSTFTYVIVVRRQRDVLERYPLDAARRAELAGAIARATLLAGNAQRADSMPTVISEPVRGQFVANQTALGGILFGPAAAAMVGDNAQLNDRRRLVATFLAPRDDHWRTLSPFDMQRLFAEVAHLMSGE